MHRKSSKKLPIAFAVIALLTFVFREVLQANLKEFRDSLTKAEEQYQTESNESDSTVRFLGTLQEMEALQKRPDPNDYSLLINQDMAEARTAETNGRAYFDSVSQLIDSLPAGAKDLRSSRELMRKSLDQMSQNIDKNLNPSPDHDAHRFAQVKAALLFALAEGIPLAVLADGALTRAHQVEHAADTLIRVCSWCAYILGFLAALLGVFAAFRGKNLDNT